LLVHSEIEYLLVSPEEDPNLPVEVVVGPKSMRDSSVRNVYGILKACVCPHTIKVYVPCVRLQTKTMIEGLDSYDLLTDPMDLLSAFQTLANPVNVHLR
jgi:hypothetical protein